MSTISNAKPVLSEHFRRYIDVYNTAIAYNHDRFPYKQIWNAAKLESIKLKIKTVVLDSDQRYDATMVLRDGVLSLMPERCCGCSDCYGEECHWIIEREELETVINHSALYITQPARLNWDWLLPDGPHLSEQGNPELQAEQANSESCLKDSA